MSNTPSMPDWVNKLKIAYENGASDTEVCKELEITKGRFNELYKSNAGFKNIVDYGRMLQEAWWMEKGRSNLWNKSFNVTLWSFNMKNRFGWAEKNENVDKGQDETMNLDELRTLVHKALPKVIKRFAPEITDATLLMETSITDDN